MLFADVALPFYMNPANKSGIIMTREQATWFGRHQGPAHIPVSDRQLVVIFYIRCPESCRIVAINLHSSEEYKIQMCYLLYIQDT